jgi:hypothetical protein
MEVAPMHAGIGDEVMHEYLIGPVSGGRMGYHDCGS